MTITPNYQFNSVFLSLLDCKQRNIILMGGAGSGKSVAVAQWFIHKTFTLPNHRMALIRKHLKHIRQSQYQEIKLQISKMNLNQVFTFNETDMRIKNNMTGAEIISFGLDDREKIKSIAEISQVWIEECTELDDIDDDQIDLRVRSKNALFLQVVRTFNPIKKTHWLKDKYFGDELPPLGEPVVKTVTQTIDGVEYSFENLILRTNYRHNAFIDSSSLAILERFRTTNPEYYKVYALAEWGDLELGLIFKREFYQEWTVIPSDARGVIYCDPNLSKKGQGDTTAIFSLLFSPSEQKYYITNACCKSFSTTSELLDVVLDYRKDERTKFIGFDGNVNQESQWTEHVANYSRLKGLAYPIIDYKRYRVDELAKMAQIVWCDGSVYFPPGFKYTKEGETILSQLYSFAGKKHTEGHDDAPDALICAIEYIYESGFAFKTQLSNIKF